MFLKNRSLHRKPRHNSTYLMAFHELSIGNSSKAINTTNYPIIWIRNPWLIHGVLMDFRHFTCTQVCSSAFTTVELRSSVTETKYFTIFRGFPWTCHSKPMEYHGHCRHFISLCCKSRHESWGTTSFIWVPHRLHGFSLDFNELPVRNSWGISIRVDYQLYLYDTTTHVK